MDFEFEVPRWFRRRVRRITRLMAVVAAPFLQMIGLTLDAILFVVETLGFRTPVSDRITFAIACVQSVANVI